MEFRIHCIHDYGDDDDDVVHNKLVVEVHNDDDEVVHNMVVVVHIRILVVRNTFYLIIFFKIRYIYSLNYFFN